jgi:hypothetical protein
MKQRQTLLSGFLRNVILDRLFLNCSREKIEMNLSDLMTENQIDLKSTDFSVEKLNNLLSSGSISVESEDELLCLILELGPDYQDLLK